MPSHGKNSNGWLKDKDRILIPELTRNQPAPEKLAEFRVHPFKAADAKKLIDSCECEEKIRHNCVSYNFVNFVKAI